MAISRRGGEGIGETRGVGEGGEENRALGEPECRSKTRGAAELIRDLLPGDRRDPTGLEPLHDRIARGGEEI